MLPVKRVRSALSPLAQVSEEFDNFGRFFDQALHSFGFPTVETIKRPDFVPLLGIVETEKDYQIDVEVPGMDSKEDITISIEDDETLIIKGKKEVENSNGKAESHYTERYYGEFRREVSIPKDTAPEKISAEYKNGVLKISLPKTKEAVPKSRKIDIK